MLQTMALNQMNPGSTADALFRSCKLDAKNVVGWLMTQNALRSCSDIARSRKRITLGFFDTSMSVLKLGYEPGLGIDPDFTEIDQYRVF